MWFGYYMTLLSEITTTSPILSCYHRAYNVKCNQTTCLEANMSLKNNDSCSTRSQQTHMYHLCSTCLNDYPPFHVQNNSSRSPSWQPWKTGLLDKSTKIQVPQRHQKWIPFTSFYIKIKIKSIKKIPSGLNSVFFKRSTVGPRSLVLFLY